MDNLWWFLWITHRVYSNPAKTAKIISPAVKHRYVIMASVMDVPFSPYFFKKLDVYQQLRDYELRGGSWWEGEKVVLSKVANSIYQRPLSSYLNRGHVYNFLHEDIGTTDNPREIPYILCDPADVMGNLVERGFGEWHPNERVIKINQRGYLAGKVLLETDLLGNCSRYENWVRTWWVLYWVGVVFIVFQTALTLLNFILKLVGIAKGNCC